MKHTDDENFITLKDDPRLTAIGKILRKYHLDELPQLFNVLKGDMSFVGPKARCCRLCRSTTRRRSYHFVCTAGHYRAGNPKI